MRRFVRQFALKAPIIGLSVASGCAMPRHQDAVFFGTDTKVAFDVGIQPENGNTPSVTLGYKRREFVYMPLAEYGPAPQLGVIEAVVAGDLIRGGVASDEAGTAPTTDSEKNPVGNRHKYQGAGESGKKDSYSVFATFGGNFNGSTTGGGADIKQVFATGIAAQIAAQRGEEFVSTAASDAGKEKAVADAKMAELEMVKIQAAKFEEAADQRNAIKTKIQELEDAKAIDLAKNLVNLKLIDESDVGTLCFDLSDNCPDFASDKGSEAKQYLERAVDSPTTILHPERVESWGTVLK